MVSSSAKTASSASRSCSAGLSRLVLAWIVARTALLPLVRVADIQLLARRPGQLVHLQCPASAQPAQQLLARPR